jgi:hypothetical protein
MIGYFFWHWPGGKALDVYERDLLAFHSALRAHHPDGFSCCTAARVAGAPWIPGARGYEDRYLVDSFAALGTLNEAAVSAPLTVPHEAIARQAAGGIAGLYRLRFGDAASSVNRGAIWFSKPRGMTYPELDEALSSLLQRGAALWQRQLTLGPTPEFCLDFSGRPELPAGSQPIFVSIEPLKG